MGCCNKGYDENDKGKTYNKSVYINEKKKY